MTPLLGHQIVVVCGWVENVARIKQLIIPCGSCHYPFGRCIILIRRQSSSRCCEEHMKRGEKIRNVTLNVGTFTHASTRQTSTYEGVGDNLGDHTHISRGNPSVDSVADKIIPHLEDFSLHQRGILYIKYKGTTTGHIYLVWCLPSSSQSSVSHFLLD